MFDSLLSLEERVKMMVRIESYRFPNPYQYKTVDAGASDIVWELRVSAGYKAFLSKIYNNWFASTWLELIADGFPIESKIERQIGSLTELESLPSELIAEKWIRLIAHNNDSSSHVFEAVLDGLVCKQV